MEESSLLLSEENLAALTDALFDDADTDKSGTITFQELKCQLEKHPGVMNNLTIRWVPGVMDKLTVRWVGYGQSDRQVGGL